MYYPARGREHILEVRIFGLIGIKLRNVLPRKGTRTQKYRLYKIRYRVKKCITPQGDENLLLAMFFTRFLFDS